MRPALAPGNRTTKVKDTATRARRPTEEETYTPDGGWSLFDPTHFATPPPLDPAEVPPTSAEVPPPPARPLVTDQAAELDLRARTTKPLTKASRQSRARTQKALALLASGYSIPDAAHELGVHPATLTGYLARHRRQVQLTDIDADLDQIAVPLASENLIHGLLAGDKDYTLETLKGRGAFKRHSDGKDLPSTVMPALEIRIVMPEAHTHTPIPDGSRDTRLGTVAGAPRLPKAVDGSVVRRTLGVPHHGEDL